MVSRCAITIYANLSEVPASNPARAGAYTGLVARVFQMDLTEDELKMIVAALRQVRHTFQVARRQDEDLLSDEYQRVERMYDALHGRLAAMLPPDSPPRRVK
jgi:hypothetical protein